MSSKSNIMLVNKDGDLEVHAMYDTPKQVLWSARGDLGVGAGGGISVWAGWKRGEVVREPWELVEGEGERRKATPSVRGENDDRDKPRLPKEKPAVKGRGKLVSAVVEEDVSMTMRRRVVSGYGLGTVSFFYFAFGGR
jgi:hypothetical protein